MERIQRQWHACQTAQDSLDQVTIEDALVGLGLDKLQAAEMQGYISALLRTDLQPDCTITKAQVFGFAKERWPSLACWNKALNIWTNEAINKCIEGVKSGASLAEASSDLEASPTGDSTGDSPRLGIVYRKAIEPSPEQTVRVDSLTDSNQPLSRSSVDSVRCALDPTPDLYLGKDAIGNKPPVDTSIMSCLNSELCTPDIGQDLEKQDTGKEVGERRRTLSLNCDIPQENDRLSNSPSLFVTPTKDYFDDETPQQTTETTITTTAAATTKLKEEEEINRRDRDISLGASSEPNLVRRNTDNEERRRSHESKPKPEPEALSSEAPVGGRSSTNFQVAAAAPRPSSASADPTSRPTHRRNSFAQPARTGSWRRSITPREAGPKPPKPTSSQTQPSKRFPATSALTTSSQPTARPIGDLPEPSFSAARLLPTSSPANPKSAHVDLPAKPTSAHVDLPAKPASAHLDLPAKPAFRAAGPGWKKLASAEPAAAPLPPESPRILFEAKGRGRPGDRPPLPRRPAANGVSRVKSDLVPRRLPEYSAAAAPPRAEAERSRPAASRAADASVAKRKRSRSPPSPSPRVRVRLPDLVAWSSGRSMK